MRSHLLNLALWSPLVLGGGALPAQSVEDLKALRDTKVKVASKTDESLLDAPGSASVFLDRDLAALGLYNLGDLSAFAAGYSPYTIYGERVFETRGQKAGSFNNNKHLLLVDGIPFAHARNGKVPIEGELPLLFAHQVEFLRGPASSLYGTGAFFGVVNITSQSAPDGNWKDMLWTGGSPQSFRRLMGSVGQGDEDSESILALGYGSQTDSLSQVGLKVDPTNLFRDRQETLFLQARHRIKQGPLAGLSIGTLFSRKNGGLGEFWDGTYTNPQNDLTWSTLVPYLKYERELVDHFRVEAKLFANESVEAGRTATDATLAAGFGYRSRVNALGAGLEVRWTGLPNASLIAGVDADSRREAFTAYAPGPGGTTLDVSVPETPPYRTLGLYLQWQQALPWELAVTAGLRFDRGTNPIQSYQQMSPRLALVRRFGEADSLKVLFGTALRGPGIKEVGLNREAAQDHQVFIPNLKAETFQSTELVWVHAYARGLMSFTLFSNQTRDALDGNQVAGVNVFMNAAGTSTARGWEWEGQYLGRDLPWRIRGQVSFAKAEGLDGRSLPDVPTWKAALAFMGPLWREGPHGTLRVTRVDGYRRSGGSPLPGATFVDALLGTTPWSQGVRFQVEVRNLFGQTYQYPKNGVPDVPLPGRTIWLSLGWRQ